MAWITIVCPCLNQLIVIIARVLVMAGETPPFRKGLMDGPTGNFIQHALMAVKTDPVLAFNQKLPVGR